MLILNLLFSMYNLPLLPLRSLLCRRRPSLKYNSAARRALALELSLLAWPQVLQLELSGVR